jgi:hypothetical protein
MTIYNLYQQLKAIEQRQPNARTEGFKLEIIEVPAPEKHRVVMIRTGVAEKASDMAKLVARMFCDHPSNMGPSASQVHFVQGFWNFCFRIKASNQIYSKI